MIGIKLVQPAPQGNIYATSQDRGGSYCPLVELEGIDTWQ